MIIQVNIFSNFIRFTRRKQSAGSIKKSQFNNIKQLYPFTNISSSFKIFPLSVSNQQSAIRCSININNRWQERLEDRACLRLKTRRAIVLWQAVGSKRENHGLISRKWGRERKRKTEGSETSERDKLESGTGERKLPRAWKRNEDWSGWGRRCV